MTLGRRETGTAASPWLNSAGVQPGKPGSGRGERRIRRVRWFGSLHAGGARQAELLLLRLLCRNGLQAFRVLWTGLVSSMRMESSVLSLSAR